MRKNKPRNQLIVWTVEKPWIKKMTHGRRKVKFEILRYEGSERLLMNLRIPKTLSIFIVNGGNLIQNPVPANFLHITQYLVHEKTKKKQRKKPFWMTTPIYVFCYQIVFFDVEIP